MTSTASLIDLLASAVPAVDVVDGSPPRDPITGRLPDLSDPCICVYGGARAPHNRRYGGTAQSRSVMWQIVCVNNSAEGVRHLAGLVVDALDSTGLGDCLLAVLAVSAPLEDRDDPSEYRWSITVEVSHCSPA